MRVSIEDVRLDSYLSAHISGNKGSQLLGFRCTLRYPRLASGKVVKSCLHKEQAEQVSPYFSSFPPDYYKPFDEK